MSAVTIFDYFAHHVAQQPDNLALVCVDQKSRSQWSYKLLHQKVLHLASHLQAYVGAGERALILMDTGIDYVTSFLACQYIGVTAIPSFPPESAKAQHIARTVGIAEDSEAALLLTTERFANTVDCLCQQVANSQMIVVDQLPDETLALQKHHAKVNEISFLQYTSGSTAKPKGVMVSHGNLIANEQVIAERMEITQRDVMVTWLPLFHDMGLIGGLLQPLFTGFPLVLTSPRYFMERPLRWLQLLSEYKGTLSGGPDFSFRLCIERIKPQQLESLDLSSWRVAFSGAEPIRHDTLMDFADKYAICGFNKQALYPCYGLAEGTLMVTGSDAWQGANIQAFDNTQLAAGKALVVESKDFRNTEQYSHQVGCGSVGRDHYVRITDSTGLVQLADGEIGEIWASGPSIALGYWRNEVATQAAFVEHDGKRWLRTGDVGYVHHGQLFISGRQKDLIIINGHNIYPQDIERAIEADLSFVRKGRVSAFPVPSKDSGEGIGLAIETANRYRNQVTADHTAQIIRDFIIEQFGVCPQLVLLLSQGGLPKTSSGKLQRSACLKLHKINKLASYGVFEHEALQQLVQGDENIPEHWGVFELEMAALWQQVLRYPVKQDKADFFALGGSSIKAAQLLALVQNSFNCHIDSTALFTAHKFSDFCQLIGQAQQQDNQKLALKHQQKSSYPLSTQQFRQLFLWQLQPDSTAYHIGAAFHFSGELNTDWLQQACDHVIKQHCILRTRYEKSQQNLWQQTVIDIDFIIEQQDVSERSNPQQAARQWLETFNQRPFRLDEGENIRCAVVRLADKTIIWSLMMHHIAGDAWSFELLTKQIAEHYQLLSERKPLPQIELSLQYGDYAQWQQDWLLTIDAKAQLDYWQERLSSFADQELLPPQYERTNKASTVTTNSLHLHYKQVEQLQAFAHQSGASLYMLLLASLQVLFYRLNGKQRPSIGVPVANRRSQQTQAMVGFFVNTQVIGGEISPEFSFHQVLTATKQAALEAQQHQDYPFEKLVEVLNPERKLGQNPLFQLMFNHVEYDLSAWSQVDGLRLEEILPLRHQAQFDLSIDSRLFKDGNMQLELQYNADLYDASVIEQLKANWSSLLMQLLIAPHKAIGDLPLVADSAHQLRLGQGKIIDETPTDWLADISRIAQKHPKRTALIYQDQSYSYQWLEQTANQIAHGIVQQGIGLDAVVGILLPREPMMLVSTLACLKAGVAYLPLDSNFPQQKLNHMLSDSGCRWVLTEYSHLNDIVSNIDCLSPSHLVKAYGTDMTAPKVGSYKQQLAYLNYTSGSTGLAKGIAISRGALSEYIGSAIDFIGLTAKDVVLQFATANFDAFVEQVFPTWAVGAAMVLRGDDLWDAETLYQQALKHQISVMDLSAAYWRSIAASWAKRAEHHGPLQLPALRQVHSGGESMSTAGVNDWRKAGLEQVRLLNTYGPTEIVVEAAIYDCRDKAIGASVPLGEALAGRQLYVLDHNLQLVDEGQVGELFVGGDIQARGYWGKPDLTAERFIADPFNQIGGRMYATGDLVRWQDGELYYVGRRDHQVKVRGFRVELGEVEQALTHIEGITQAVVQTIEVSGVLELVAYVETTSLDVTEIKHQLSDKLAQYMIPTHIMTLAQLPVNASGKLERHLLPQVELSQPCKKPLQLASNDIEQKISAVWQQHLRLDDIDIHSNFFDLGGHSLLLMAVHEQLQIDYPKLQLTDLFAHANIASLAIHIHALQNDQSIDTGAKKPDAKQQKRAMNSFAAKRRNQITQREH